MTASMPEPWKHHFVPRSLLKFFCPPDNTGFIYVYDKRLGRSFPASLMNAGSENAFNTIEGDDGVINFESDFDEADASLASQLREIHGTESVASLSAGQRKAWADLVAVQLVRTPIVRSTMKTVMQELKEQVAEKFGAEIDVPVPTENDVRKAARGLFADREDARHTLEAKDMVLFQALGDTLFRISDRPVTLHSSLPFGDAGLASHGVAVFMPLGQRLMLGFCCPSIRRKLNKAPIEKLGIPDEARSRLVALREGLATGSVVQLNETMVKRHNDQQIAGCMRFVYGPTEHFKDVQAFLSAHPEARNIQSSIKLGKIGHGPGPKPQMPLGSWLVLFGRTESHMLEVQDASEDEPFEVTVRSEAALEAILRDGPFSEMRYYVEKFERRGMRDVCLVRIEGKEGRRVQVRHLNPALDALMGAVGKRAI